MDLKKGSDRDYNPDHSSVKPPTMSRNQEIDYVDFANHVDEILNLHIRDEYKIILLKYKMEELRKQRM